MRIISFPKLINSEETEKCCLQNCKLVIDGHSFFYNSYEESKVPYVFGSDAKEYSRYLGINKLLKFKRANVKCYFVFKGGNDNIEEKIQNTKTEKFDFESNRRFVNPVFQTEICLQILEEVGLNYTTCVTSNKDECVALAQALKCPILSNSIEYCFKSVPYILTDSLQYTNPNNYITGRQYELNNFLQKHSLTEKKLAIFAALSDVHVFEIHYFDELFKTWDVCNQILYLQNKNLIEWLSKHTEEEALSDVSEFLKDEIENKKFLNQIQNILDQMHSSLWTIATDYLFNNCRISFLTPDLSWFEKGVVSQNIAIPYINLYKHKAIAGSTAIEKKDATDSIMFAMNIIVYAYSLLTNFQAQEISLYQNAENIIKINTEDYNVKKPRYECKESVFENGWEVVRHMNLFDYFLRENRLNTEYIHRLPLESRVMLIALAYFSKKKMSQNIDVTKEVYCYLIYYSVSHQLMLFDLHNTNREECETLIQITEKYFKLEADEEKDIFDGAKLKTLVELQYCILHMNYLNVLCGKKYFPTRYNRFINGPFVYKLLHDMENLNVHVFLQSLFHSVPIVLNHFQMLINGYNDLLGTRKPIENWRKK